MDDRACRILDLGLPNKLPNALTSSICATRARLAGAQRPVAVSRSENDSDRRGACPLFKKRRLRVDIFKGTGCHVVDVTAGCRLRRGEGGAFSQRLVGSGRSRTETVTGLARDPRQIGSRAKSKDCPPRCRHGNFPFPFLTEIGCKATVAVSLPGYADQ